MARSYDPWFTRELGLRELERRFPDVPVLPAGVHERALCHVLEEYADEALYVFGLYYHWHEPTGREAARRYFARTLVGRVLFRPSSSGSSAATADAQDGGARAR